MNKQQLEAYRQRLLGLAARLRNGVAGLRDAALRQTGGESSGSLSNIPLHLADLAGDNFDQEIAVGMLQNEHDLLLAITAALDRMDAGTFGRCEQCGKDIPEQRLDAVPYARFCVKCQQQLEATG
jgi:RNA polymerase-binding transcription factor DksA